MAGPPVTIASTPFSAHLLELAGDNDPAIAHYRAASARTASLPARNYLLTPAARLAEMKQYVSWHSKFSWSVTAKLNGPAPANILAVPISR